MAQDIRDLRDMVMKMQSIDDTVTAVRKAVVLPTWKKIVYGLGIAFLTASTTRYWLNKIDPPHEIVRYVSVPCAGATLEPEQVNYGR